MSLQSQLSGIDSRLSTLETQKHSNDDVAAVRTELTKICMYLFGYNHAPDVQRNKSNIKGGN